MFWNSGVGAGNREVELMAKLMLIPVIAGCRPASHFELQPSNSQFVAHGVGNDRVAVLVGRVDVAALSRRAQSAWPFSRAFIRAVEPSDSATSTSQPLSTSTRAQSAWPFSHASIRAVQPSESPSVLAACRYAATKCLLSLSCEGHDHQKKVRAAFKTP